MPFDSRHVRVLPVQLQGVACCVCGKTKARWEITSKARGEGFICSSCYLYGGVIPRSEVDYSIEEIEKLFDRKFAKDDCGFLIKTEDQDRVTGALIAAEKMVYFLSISRAVCENG